MIPMIPITNDELSAVRNCRNLSLDDNAYSAVYKTMRNTVVKLYNKTVSDAETISRDIETLTAISQTDIQFNDRFILPDKILAYDGEIIGYEMPFFEGEHLSDALKKVSVAKAGQWFLQIYDDICFLNNIPVAFSFGDLHEENILIDKNGQLLHCDVDGWVIHNEKGKHARYLTMLQHLFDNIPSKYKTEMNSPLYLADLNTDIACLIVMIMNYLMGYEISFAKLQIRDVVDYLEYLKMAGLPEGIIRMVQTLYCKTDNYFCKEDICRIPENISRFAYSQYLSATSIFHNNREAISFLNNVESHYRK